MEMPRHLIVLKDMRDVTPEELLPVCPIPMTLQTVVLNETSIRPDSGLAGGMS